MCIVMLAEFLNNITYTLEYSLFSIHFKETRGVLFAYT